MIQLVVQKKIGELFDPEAKTKYHVPKYQREYVWSYENWELLYNDIMEECEDQHYLGTIITINTAQDSEKPDLEIIDGQQRLTTISILFIAIYRCLKEKNKEDDSFIANRINLKNRIVIFNTTIPRLELSRQNNNDNDYKAILGTNEVGLFDQTSKPSNMGNRRIQKAFKYFYDQLKSIPIETLLKFQNKLYSATLVKIEVTSHSDAFTLFESLNNRGVPLSAIDIIKNKALSELEKANTDLAVDSAFDSWQRIIENLPEYDEQERFLRHFYNAFRYKDSIKIKGFTKAQRTSLIKIYEELFKKNAKLIFDLMVEKSDIYNLIVSPSVENKFYEELNDLDHIGSTPGNAFVLYLLSEHEKEESLVKKSLRFLVKYFLFKNITNYPRSNDLDTIFIGLIDECQKEENLQFNTIYEYLKTRMSNTEDITRILNGPLYLENAKLVRFLLCKIEESKRNEENKIDFWKKNEKGKFEWTIEHILPEGKNLPNDWICMLGENDFEKASQIQEKCVHKLGNLTLSRYNSKLSNFSFEKKKSLKDDNHITIGYLSRALTINGSIIDKDIWAEKEIEERNSLLINELKKIFGF